MAWSTGSFLFQINPLTRIVGYAIWGEDVGADEQAMLNRFGAASWEAIKNSPTTLMNLEKFEREVEQLLLTEGATFIYATATGDQAYFDSRVESLSPGVQAALQMARLALVEIGHLLVDQFEPEPLGRLIGQIIYECVEDAALTSVLATLEVGTAGASTPVIGAVVAAKAAKLSRLIDRMGGWKIVQNVPAILKAVEHLQDAVVWMTRLPICFVAGTPVHAEHGLKPIEEIGVGDLVLSRPETEPLAKPGLRPVLRTIVTRPTRLYHVRFVVGGTQPFETLVGTGEHPFYVVNRGSFVPAKQLALGDVLSLADGRNATVCELHIEEAPDGETFTTYNFEVAGDHTYFVGQAGAWVHNQGDPCMDALQVFFKALRDGLPEGGALEKVYKFLKERSNLNSTFAKHLKDFERLLGEVPIAQGSAARKLLATALGANPYPVAAEAHHIFPVSLFDTPLGKKLRGWAIDLNGKDNGVLLPKLDFPGRKAALHNGRHLDAIVEEVKRELSKADNRDKAIAILDYFRKRLRDGDMKLNNAK